MKARALAAFFETLSHFHRSPAEGEQLRGLAREVRALSRPLAPQGLPAGAPPRSPGGEPRLQRPPASR